MKLCDVLQTVVLAAVLSLSALAGPIAFAQPPAGTTDLLEVDVELVLAVDISYSVDEEEARRQRAGYVAALASAEVISAIESGMLGRIAVTYVEWADARHQRAAADWTVIASEADARAFAAAVAEAPYERGQYTAIGAAIADGVRRIESNGYTAYRRIIDISGDGPQNQGMSLVRAHGLADQAGVVVNGLPVLARDSGNGVMRAEIDLDQYFEDQVITGAGAFVLPARTQDEFRQAILRKLVLEIAGLQPGDPLPDDLQTGRAP